MAARANERIAPGTSSKTDRVRPSAGPGPIDGPNATAFNDDDEGHGDREKVILDTFACFVAAPVHEEAVPGLHQSGDDHDGSNAEGRDASEKSDDEPERAEKLGRDGEKCEHDRDSHVLGEKLHRALEPTASEPAQELLGAVGKHDRTEGDAHDEWRDIVCGREDLVEHDEVYIVMLGLTAMSMSRLTLLLTLLSAGALRAQPSEPEWSRLEEETLRHFRALLQFDTSDPPGRELPAAEYLKRVLEDEGIPVEMFALDAERPNVVARLKGSGAKEPLLIMAHTDVVNVDPAKWTFPPFSATLDGGYVYARGTVDDKDNVVASLMVMLELKRLGRAARA